MKQISILLQALTMLCAIPCFAQNSGNDVFQKADNAVNKVNTIIAVFQPYLLKARQLYYEGKQLAGDVKNSANSTFGKNGTLNNGGTNNGYSSGSGYNQVTGYTDPSSASNSGYNNTGNSTYPTASNSASSGAYNGNNANNQNSGVFNNSGYGQSSNIPDYLPNQSLPVNNPASVNNDGTGNWGNQNNGLYGNCLDALTGTVMGMGEAQDKPGSVDLLFFAPSDGQNDYTIMTPGFARNNSTATYMSEGGSDGVMQWADVNETEVALTHLTLSQFDQIQNNNQILNAVRMAPDYAGYYSVVGHKMDGMVFAVRASLENRQVYALVAVYRQIGTSGNNGYLKIKIKAQGLDANGNGLPTANYYQR